MADVGCETLGLCGPSELRAARRSCGRRVVLPEIGSAPRRSGDATSVEDAVRQQLCPEAAVAAKAMRAHGFRKNAIQTVLSFLPSPWSFAKVHRPPAWSALTELLFRDFQSSTQLPNRELELVLDKAWDESPDGCLRAILCLGEWRRRHDRLVFFDASLWLWRKHPATLLSNLVHFKAGCWNHLSELLTRVCEGPELTRARDRAWHCKKELWLPRLTTDDGFSPFANGGRLNQAARALRRYDEDPMYRALFNQVASLFAAQLRRDIEAQDQISFCAAWCPGLDTSFDRRTLICEGIARRLFPQETYPEFAGLEERHYSFLVRDRLRREVLVPLKVSKASRESLWAARAARAADPSNISLGRDSGACPSGVRDAFKIQRWLGDVEDARDRAAEYVRNRSGGPTWKSGQRQQIIRNQAKAEGVQAALSIARWTRRALEIRDRPRRLRSGVAAVMSCSYGMDRECLRGVCCRTVAAALTLVLAEVEGPFKGKAIVPGYKEDDNNHQVPTHGGYSQRCGEAYEVGYWQNALACGVMNFAHHKLRRRAAELLSTRADGPVNLASVLEVARGECTALNHEGPQRATLGDFFPHMLKGMSGPSGCPNVRRLLILSDKDANATTGLTDIELHALLREAQGQYSTAGMLMPEVVFWNLAGRDGAPTIARHGSFVQLSGFSLSLHDLALNDGALDPAEAVATAIAGFASARAVRSNSEAAEIVRTCLASTTVEVSLAPVVTSLPKTLSFGLNFNGVDLCFVVEEPSRDRRHAIEFSARKIIEMASADVSRSLGLGSVTKRLAMVYYRNDGADAAGPMIGPFQLVPNQCVWDFAGGRGRNAGRLFFSALDAALSLDWQGSLRFLVLIAEGLPNGWNVPGKPRLGDRLEYLDGETGTVTNVDPLRMKPDVEIPNDWSREFSPEVRPVGGGAPIVQSRHQNLEREGHAAIAAMHRATTLGVRLLRVRSRAEEKILEKERGFAKGKGKSKGKGTCQGRRDTFQRIGQLLERNCRVGDGRLPVFSLNASSEWSPSHDEYMQVLTGVVAGELTSLIAAWLRRGPDDAPRPARGSALLTLSTRSDRLIEGQAETAAVIGNIDALRDRLRTSAIEAAACGPDRAQRFQVWADVLRGMNMGNMRSRIRMVARGRLPPERAHDVSMALLHTGDQWLHEMPDAKPVGWKQVDTTVKYNVSGSSFEVCNGAYHCVGRFNGKPKFSNGCGATIYFAGGWKLTNRGYLRDFSDWKFKCDSEAKQPPGGRWEKNTAPPHRTGSSTFVVGRLNTGAAKESEDLQDNVLIRLNLCGDDLVGVDLAHEELFRLPALIEQQTLAHEGKPWFNHAKDLEAVADALGVTLKTLQVVNDESATDSEAAGWVLLKWRQTSCQVSPVGNGECDSDSGVSPVAAPAQWRTDKIRARLERIGPKKKSFEASLEQVVVQRYRHWKRPPPYLRQSSRTKEPSSYFSTEQQDQGDRIPIESHIAGADNVGDWEPVSNDWDSCPLSAEAEDSNDSDSFPPVSNDWDPVSNGWDISWDNAEAD